MLVAGDRSSRELVDGHDPSRDHAIGRFCGTRNSAGPAAFWRRKSATTAFEFDINQAFATFMRDIGGSPSDGGGTVAFTGRDPILRRAHFRIGTSMALPAMAAGVGAAAIWKDRTGEGQDIKVDLREAVYNVNPLLTPIMQHRVAVGAVPANDPVPRSFTFTPTINGRFYQAPVGLGNPFSFVAFKTKDGRYVNVTGAYPHLNDRALRLLRTTPDRESIARAIKQWDAAALDDAMIETRTVGGVHRTTQEWLQHPEVKAQPLLFPPTLVLNDYIAGYLGAAGVIAALRRRAREGGSYHVRVSLSRAAMWYREPGLFPTTEFDATHPDHRMIAPETVKGQTPFGEVHRLAPLVKLSKTPGRWRDPLLVVRGSGRPVWQN